MNNASDRSPTPSAGLVRTGPQDAYFDRARSSIKQAINRYSQQLRLRQRQPNSIELQAALKADLDRLTYALEKLQSGLLRIAVFGLVSRGKSAVINALLGHKTLQTGPINGVTQFPRSVYWSAAGQFQVELIDTPGLDEVGGELRATMAQEVASQADLILFVVAGDITRTEYQALRSLQAANKPIVLVFNKIDLYPNLDRQTVYRKLQGLFANDRSVSEPPAFLPSDIVLIAAEPAAVEVRTEWADGQVTQAWETPEPQIDELRDKLLHLLADEGKSLLALNALRQTREIESLLAKKTVKLHSKAAEDLIWQFAKWKALVIAINPIAALDVMGGAAVDLVMIRSLSKLFGLPMTQYEAGKLLQAILVSSGGVLLGELGSSMVLGVGKSAAALATAVDSVNGLMAYSTAAVAQGSLAGYGSYRVGKATQRYLEQGCTWGAQGADTVIQELLSQVDRDTVLYRLKRSLQPDGEG